MFCKKCGKELPDDSLFCSECGTERVIDADDPGIEVHKVRAVTSPPLSPETIEKHKKRNKIIHAGVGGALILCLIIGIASMFMKPTINLNEYLIVTFEGYNTVGKAVLSVDSDKLREYYEKNLGAGSNRNPAGFDDFIQTCVDGVLNKTRGLSNGDIVTFTWNCNDKHARKYYGFKLKYKDVEYTVSGLAEPEVFDPFDGIEVVFEGISPNGIAKMTGEPVESAAQELNYWLDKDRDLQNGDTVTITASLTHNSNTSKYFINNYGMIPSTLKKTYTVEGLTHYIRSLEEISAASLEEMKAQAEAVYHADVAKKWGDDEKLTSFTYLGSYLITRRNYEDFLYATNNALYLVYRAQVQNDYSYNSETYSALNDIYWYIGYQNLGADPTGAVIVDIENYTVPRDAFIIESGISIGWWGTQNWYYKGYQSLDEVYTAIDAEHPYEHKVEVNVDASTVAAETTTIEEQTDETAEGGRVIFPNSSEELLNGNDIEALSDEEIRYAINEIYARHGYIFADAVLRQYYAQFGWYEEKIGAGDFTIELFNEVEKENIERMQRVRNSRD